MLLDMIGDRLPDVGLCMSLMNTKYERTLDGLFYPTDEEIRRWNTRYFMWGADYKEIPIEEERLSSHNICYGLTPTRITILLLIAAMHNEL